MNGKWLVRLYPKTWRRRYEDEFMAMLEQMPPSLSDTVNIFAGIFDAYLLGDGLSNQLSGLERMQYMLERLRSYYGKGIILFLLFITPGFLFNTMLDDSPFLPVMRDTMAFNLAYKGFNIGVALVLIAVLVGGLLVLFNIWRRSVSQKRKGILTLFMVPVFAFVIIAAAGLYIDIALAHTIPGWTRGNINQCLVVLFLLICGICVYRILQTGEIEEAEMSEKQAELYKIGMYAAPVAAIGMGIATLSVIVWGILANHFAPVIMQNSTLGIFHMNTLLFYLTAAFIMLAASCVSGFVAFRGVRYMAIEAKS